MFKKSRYAITATVIALVGAGVWLLWRDMVPQRDSTLVAGAEHQAPEGLGITTATISGERQLLPEDETIRKLVVRVEAPSGQPLENAQVFLVKREGQLRHAGDTDSTGRAAVSVCLGEELALADAAGFAESDPQPLGAASEVLLVLGRGGIVQGTCSWRDGTPASGAVVVAYPAYRSYSFEGDIAGDWKRLSGIESATADSRGHFRLKGLPDNVASLVSAGLPAGACLAAVKAFTGENVGVTIDPVYVSSVSFIDQGASPKADALLFRGGFNWSLEDQRGEGFAPDWTQPGLALALGGSTEQASSVGHGLRMFFKSPRQLPFLGPVHLHVDLPGYVPVWAELSAVPCGDSVREHGVWLSPETICWGSLTASLVGVFRERDPVSSDRPIVKVELVPAEVGGEVLSFVLRESAISTPMRLSGVPCGDYSVHTSWIDNASALGDQRPWTTKIRHDEASNIEVELPPRTGNARLHVRTPGDREYSGPLVVKLRKTRLGEHGYEVSYVSYTKGPYCLYGLLEGDYDLSVERVRGYGSGSPRLLVILPSVTTEEILVLEQT